jgi:hypothetical protein
LWPHALGAGQRADAAGALAIEPPEDGTLGEREAMLGAQARRRARLERSEHVEHMPEPAFDTATLPASDGPLVVVPAVP